MKYTSKHVYKYPDKQAFHVSTCIPVFLYIQLFES
jgi:hypothetical protein